MTDENIKSVPEKSVFIDDDKNTNLHYQAACGNLEEVIKEIDGGSQVDPQNFLGWTPLMMAVRNGQLEVVEYLIERRADSTSQNKFGYNMLMMAVASGEIRILHIVLQHLLCGGVSKRSLQHFFSPISLAILFGFRHIVEYLVQNGFCPNAIGLYTESTPIAFATLMGNVEMCQYLITNGAMPAPNEQLNIHKYRMPDLSPLIVMVTSPQVRPSPFGMNEANPIMLLPRRCSDLQTPFFSPHLSPVSHSPYLHQVFFPPNFSPNHFITPPGAVPYYGGCSPNVLNMGVMQPSPYMTESPVFIPSSFNMAS